MANVPNPTGEKTLIPDTFIPTVKLLRMNRKYALFAMLYGLTTLILPLAVQFLVNNLALAGIWINIVGFIVIIAAGLVLSLILKYSQIILQEYLQRELFYTQALHWKKGVPEPNRKYFMEIFFSIKSFAKAFTTVTEIALVTIFGMMVVVVFHPGFIILPVLIGVTLWQVNRTTTPAIKASIELSSEKYHLFENVLNDTLPEKQSISSYLRAREDRFYFIKRNSVKVFSLYIVCQLLLLGGGSILIQASQLSIGQLVSAEIILTNIMVSLHKLPEALEGIYDFETNMYKIAKALGGKHD